MNELINLNINYKATLVVILIDDYTSKLVIGGNTSVSIDEVLKKPIKKNDACYVFVDVKSDIYNINIKSNRYFQENIKITTEQLDAIEPVVYVRLKPLPSYDFDEDDTLVRLMVKNSKGCKLEGAKVTSLITSPEGSKIKIIEEKIEKDKKCVNFSNIKGILTINEELYIKDNEKSEYCQIKKIIDYENKDFELLEPLKFQHGRGTLLMPVIKTYTDFKGEAVIYFKNIISKTVEMQITIEYENKYIAKNAIMEQGKTLVIKDINL